jgi:hypothetical protein
VKWRDETLDAALIEVSPPLPADMVAVKWGEGLPAQNVTWDSTGYPEASVVDTEMGQAERKSAGLQGTLYSSGGGGQGRKELDLGVADPPAMKNWAGASGAPVFVGDALVGLVKATGFDGRRFQGTPTMALRQNVGFRLATEPAWLEYPRSGPWVLALVSEAGSEQDFLEAVRGSFERHQEPIEIAMGAPLPSDRVFPARASDALDTPGRWLQLVQAMCAAPLMIADVTGFEPGVMLALGVRAVVRRGVTVASTSKSLDDTEFAALPFNIQETKLISHGRYPGITDEDPRYSLNIIARTFLSGIVELKTNPRYLDLPTYDAVRCPAPELPTEQQRTREAVLVLCSFHEGYAPHWGKLIDALARHYPTKRTLRMRDIASPRLVGQALYEHIRWTTTCVVDWTHWRANVFFELGVRLACSKIEPVCLLEASDVTPPKLQQKEKLRLLFGPTRYTLSDVRPALQEALTAHEQQKTLKDGDEMPSRAEGRVPFNGTYNASLAAFEFGQEHVTTPHGLLRFLNEAMLGKDPQRTGELPVLFSANPEFNTKLSCSVRERWIAAWLYLRNRYPEGKLRSDARLSREIKQLGETLLQELRNAPDEFISNLSSQVVDFIDSLGDEETELEKS